MPPRKRRRTCAPPRTAATAPVLPANLLAEIAARSDATTIFRCAATCKPLRRAILCPDFIRRVTGGPDDDAAVVPSSVLGVVGESDASFSIVHPATVPALTFARRHLAPFVWRSAAELLKQYVPLTSRRGLLLMERRDISWRRRRSEPERRRRSDDLCVYDPMTDNRTFFPVLEAPDAPFPTRLDMLVS